MADSYVCSKAKIKCSCGDRISTLTVFPDRTIWLTGQPQANISDHIPMRNIAPFGRCHTTRYPATGAATAAAHGKLTPMPCVPNTPFPWMGGKNDVILKGQPALLKSSTCKCVWGGTISITYDGQTIGDLPDGKRDKALGKDALDNESVSNEDGSISVLDSIQLVLDAAGFVPGFGAVPDLLNAAISACRGNWMEAGFSILAAIPVIGDAAAATKIATKAAKLSKKARRCASRNVDVSIKSLVGKGMSVKEAKTFSRAVRNERRTIASNFYSRHTNMSPAEINDHMRGIDFTKKVEIKTIPPAGEKATLYQYRVIDNSGHYRPGQYYTANPNAKPSELGIANTYTVNNANRAEKQLGLPFQKEKFVGELTEPTPSLHSTSRRIHDTWSKSGESVLTEGGGAQIFISKDAGIIPMSKI